MADFCTLADVEALLGLQAADPAAAELAITQVSAAIRGVAGQPCELEVGRVVTMTALPYRETLVLPVSNVVEVTSLTEDGVALTVDTDYRYSDSGLLWRLGARYWSSKVHGVVATVTAGFASDSIVMRALNAVASGAALRRYQNVLRSVASSGAGGVQSESMPDYQVSFGVDLGGAYSMLLLPSEVTMIRRLVSKGVG